jgi:antitoxin YokJ
MPDITSLVAEIRSKPGCSLRPSSGLPNLPSGFAVAVDLRQFYELAGGGVIHEDRICPGPARIVGPEEFQRIDMTICAEVITPGPFEYWFAIADVADGNFIAIDLHPDHSGMCYDCFHETFAIPGYVSIIASSFSDLLHRLLHHTEDSSYWLEEGFEPLGEAFRLYGHEPVA